MAQFEKTHFSKCTLKFWYDDWIRTRVLCFRKPQLIFQLGPCTYLLPTESNCIFYFFSPNFVVCRCSLLIHSFIHSIKTHRTGNCPSVDRSFCGFIIDYLRAWTYLEKEPKLLPPPLGRLSEMYCHNTIYYCHNTIYYCHSSIYYCLILYCYSSIYYCHNAIYFCHGSIYNCLVVYTTPIILYTTAIVVYTAAILVYTTAIVEYTSADRVFRNRVTTNRVFRNRVTTNRVLTNKLPFPRV